MNASSRPAFVYIYVERCKDDKYFGNMQYFMNKIWINR